MDSEDEDSQEDNLEALQQVVEQLGALQAALGQDGEDGLDDPTLLNLWWVFLSLLSSHC